MPVCHAMTNVGMSLIIQKEKIDTPLYFKLQEVLAFLGI